MKTILVTGGAGFIGSNFIHYSLKHHSQDRIINLDKLTYAGNLDNLKDISKQADYKFYKGDICDKKIVNQIFKKEKPNYVVHFAAESHVDRSINGPEIFIESNVLGTQILLEEARLAGIEKFVYISTDEVYGSTLKGKFREADIIKPNSPYSASKAAADLLTYSYFKTYGFPAVITRSSNNYGPYQYPEKLIPLFTTNLLRGKKVPVYGTGLNVRDWLYVEDNCAAIDSVLRKGKIGEVYNIGGGNELSNLEITKIVLKELKKDESFIEYVPDRLGHDFRYALDSSKIKRELGWQPKYNFSQAIIKTIQWYRENSQWWQKLIK